MIRVASVWQDKYNFSNKKIERLLVFHVFSLWTFKVFDFKKKKNRLNKVVGGVDILDY